MLVELQNDIIVFNWEELPENVKINQKLKDKIFNRLKETFKPTETVFDSKTIFKINKFIFEQINYELKLGESHGNPRNK